MAKSLSRRKFILKTSSAGAGIYLGASKVCFTGNALFCSVTDDPLLDWTSWEKYRDTVTHPCLTINQENLDFAHENIRRYNWAREYSRMLDRNARRYIDLITRPFIEKMIEETTPGHPRMTPCPSWLMDLGD